MLRHIEINDPAPVVGKDNQHEQHSQSRRGYSEEVNGHDVLDVLLQERGPRRRSRPAQLRSILLRRRLHDINPELLKFAHNTRRAPGRIGLPHASNEAPQLRRDRWATTATPTTQPTPVVTEAFVLPRQDCPRLNKEQGLAPATPHARDHSMK